MGGRADLIRQLGGGEERDLERGTRYLKKGEKRVKKKEHVFQGEMSKCGRGREGRNE